MKQRSDIELLLEHGYTAEQVADMGEMEFAQEVRQAREMADALKPHPFTAGWWMPLIVGGYAWQVHSWWIGILAFFIFVILALAFNWLLFARAALQPDDAVSDDEMPLLKIIKASRRSKWVLFIGSLILIALSGMEACSPDGACRSVWD